MSNRAWAQRRRNRLAPRRRDFAFVQGVIDAHGTALDLARRYFPNANDDDLDFVLWELTPFPLVNGAALMPYLRKARSRVGGAA